MFKKSFLKADMCWNGAIYRFVSFRMLTIRSYQNDVLRAKAGGIPTLWVNRKKKKLNPEDAAPDFVSHTLNGVLDCI
jgi:hypothetical protein